MDYFDLSAEQARKKIEGILSNSKDPDDAKKKIMALGYKGISPLISSSKGRIVAITLTDPKGKMFTI